MIYFVQDSATFLIKIGCTTVSVKGRLSALQTGNPSPLVLLAECHGDKQEEARLHRRFAGLRQNGEWFLPAPPLLQHIISLTARSSTSINPAPWLATDEMVGGKLHDLEHGDPAMLICPLCGFDYVHLIDPKPHELAVRGGTHVLSFTGECYHNWSICIGFHKGNSFLRLIADATTPDPMKEFS